MPWRRAALDRRPRRAIRRCVEAEITLFAVRDPDVWKETKSRASQVGGWTLDIVKELAKGYLKQKAQQLGFG